MSDYLKSYVKPIKIENIDEYYSLIQEISLSDTSRIFAENLSHSAHINMLIKEISILLANSLRLYEMGYFDNAYYSLRSANELATVMLDLSDKEDSEIQNNFEDFRQGKYDKMRGKIIYELSNEGIFFKEVIDKMPNFKKDISKLLSEINNVVHSNGMENFYYFRFQNFDENIHYKKLEEFKGHFRDSIKILAIMRLIVDPLPLLITDDEIYYRCPQIIFFPFRDKMLSVIGQESIDEFKQTDTYKSMEEQILSLEKRNPAVNDFLIHKVIDLDKIEDTYSQKHLISENELKILDVCSCTNKIIEINYGNGSYIFFTSLKSDGNIYNCLDIDELIKINDYYNISHKGIYVSVMNIKGNNRIDILKNSYNIVYIFHEEKLENSEIKCIEKILTDFSII